eukprot:897749-Prymnesium_polylepis.1
MFSWIGSSEPNASAAGGAESSSAEATQQQDATPEPRRGSSMKAPPRPASQMVVCAPAPVVVRAGKELDSDWVGDIAPGTVVDVKELSGAADGSQRAKLSALSAEAARAQGLPSRPGGWVTMSKRSEDGGR